MRPAKPTTQASSLAHRTDSNVVVLALGWGAFIDAGIVAISLVGRLLLRLRERAPTQLAHRAGGAGIAPPSPTRSR
ncbi:hypothetical protein [Streptomyces atratus]|uniref:hypothetical protein n=1 Tax=Streptomyces atratus TaxID=1893 RepID=UPI00130068AB|nr:hypothetical protein [Streptomyces atratus]